MQAALHEAVDLLFACPQLPTWLWLLLGGFAWVAGMMFGINNRDLL